MCTAECMMYSFIYGLYLFGKQQKQQQWHCKKQNYSRGRNAGMQECRNAEIYRAESSLSGIIRPNRITSNPIESHRVTSNWIESNWNESHRLNIKPLEWNWVNFLFDPHPHKAATHSFISGNMQHEEGIVIFRFFRPPKKPFRELQYCHVRTCGSFVEKRVVLIGTIDSYKFIIVIV